METSLETLAIELYEAKQAENIAKEKRIKAEEQIATLVATGDNESKTVAAGRLKITVKRAFGIKADVDAIRGLEIDDLPLKIIPAAWAFDEKRYEALRQQNPAVFEKIAQHVTTTPRKVAVTLKLA